MTGGKCVYLSVEVATSDLDAATFTNRDSLKVRLNIKANKTSVH